MLNMNPTSRPTKWETSTWQTTTKKSYVYLDLIGKKFISSTLEDAKSELNKDFQILTSPLLRSTSLKYLIQLQPQFSHAFHDSLAMILKLNLISPDSVFILYKPGIALEGVNLVYDYIEELLIHNKINYVIISSTGTDHRYSTVIEIENFIDTSLYGNNLSLDDYLNTFSTIRNHVCVDTAAPYRKVYLSRSHIDRRDLEKSNIDFVGFKDDVRMENEEVLEKFFIENGYEVIIPEHRFKSLKEQIKYMDTVKILASVTSSGLLNSFFMQDGQFILEIVAELVTDGGRDQSLVSYYSNYSYIKNHTHLSIQSRRDPIDVVNKLKNLANPILS